MPGDLAVTELFYSTLQPEVASCFYGMERPNGKPES
jgi:hypothetical protein